METPSKEELLKEAMAFLVSQTMGTIATVGKDNLPEAACINYFITDDWTIYLLTHADSRKVANIRQNSHIAFAVGVATVPHTAQIQADAIILEYENPEFKTVFQMLKDSKKLDRDPLYDMFSNNYVILKLKITWLRWLFFDRDNGREVYTVLIP